MRIRIVGILNRAAFVAISYALALHSSACSNEPETVEPAHLPAALQEAAYAHLLELLQDRPLFADDTIFCLGLKAGSRIDDPNESVPKSMSATRIRTFPISECEPHLGMPRHKLSGLDAMLLLVDSAKATGNEGYRIYIEWFRSGLEAEEYRCDAQAADGQWVLKGCALVAIS
jgi:hypothetical protein